MMSAPAFGVSEAALDRVHHSGDPARMGSRHDDEVRILVSRHGRDRLDFGGHGGDRNHLVGADRRRALGEVLILDVEAGEPCTDRFRRRARDVEEVAEAIVDVHHDRRRHRRRHVAGAVDHLGHADQAKIGDP